MNNIDLKQLAEAIRTMNHASPIYQVLRDELSKRGYWRRLPRGDPRKGYIAQQNKS